MLVKKELLAIPVEPMPEETGGKRYVLSAVMAEVKSEREPILAATVYNAASGRPYVRIFIGQSGHTTYFFDEDRWSKCYISSVPMQDRRYQTIYQSLCASKSSCDTVAAALRETGAVRYCSGSAEDMIDTAQRAFKQSRLRMSAEWKRWSRDENIPELPDDFDEQVLEEPFGKSRYLFYHRAGPRNDRYWEGWCTHCRREVQFDFEPQHRGWDLCPCCGSEVQYTKDYVGRKYMKDFGNILIFLPCADGGVVARGFEMVRDYSGDYRMTRTLYSENYRARFGPEGSCVLTKVYYPREHWVSSASIHEPFAGNGYAIYPLERSGLEGTVLKHSHLEEYLRLCAGRGASPIRYLALFMRHPNVEHLLCSGFEALVSEAVKGTGKMSRITDWSRSRPYQMLKSSRPELELFLREKWDSTSIYIYQLVRAQGAAPDVGEMQALRRISYIGPENTFIQAGKRFGFLRLLRYLERQAKSGHDGWREWLDYIELYRRLGVGEPEPFPPNLKKAHDDTLMRVKFEENRELREKFVLREKALSRYCWERDGLIIRPCATQEELIREGAMLKHCVASYAKRHADGETAIFFCRRADEPDRPYYTVQLDEKSGRVLQNHGYRNDAERPIPQEVRQFVKDWERDLQRIKAENLAKAKAEKKKAENAA